MKRLLQRHLPVLTYFYSYLRYRLVLLLGVSILAGILDGLGLAMFLPLLELVADQDAQASSTAMGNLAFLLDTIIALGLPLNLTVVLLTMLTFFTLKGVVKWLESYLTVVYQQYFIRSIRLENIDALTEFRFEAFVTADAGAIQNTFSGEVERVVQAYRTYSYILQQGVLLLTYATLALLANPEFALLVLAGGLLSNVLFSKLYKKTKTLSRQLVTGTHGFQGLVLQQVAFFKYLKATGSIRRYALYLKEKVYLIEDAVKKMGILDSIMAGIREPLLVAIVVGTILAQVHWLGGNLATILLSLLFFYRALSAVSLLQTSYNRFLSFSGSLQNMRDFLHHMSAQSEVWGKHALKGFTSEIVLEEISFGYRPGEWILKDINLTIKRGETLAIVGSSGAGKTTLMNLLTGLLEPRKGRLSVDGIDSGQLNSPVFRQRIGYITQEPVIFDDTVYNNVTFWAPKTPEYLTRCRKALQETSLLDFVNRLPDGLESRLGNNGINLSGGQKQRISIARELLKDIDLLFMDEATSALDSETERAIQENIERLQGQYTIVIIAHRLSTIKNADRVVVMSQGKIEQVGSYRDLITQNGPLRTMVELQEV